MHVECSGVQGRMIELLWDYNWGNAC
jgi:hypothetical protein